MVRRYNQTTGELKWGNKQMTKRTKEEQIEYFNELAMEYRYLSAIESNNWDKVAYESKAEVYTSVAFELELNME